MYLDGALVLDTNNMFRIWHVAAKSHLRTDSNEVRVGFPSPIAPAVKVASGDPFRLQSKNACWLQSFAPTEYKLMPPPAIARWCSWPGPGYSGKPRDIARRMLSGSGPGDVYQSVKFCPSKPALAPRLRIGRGQEMPHRRCKSAKSLAKILERSELPTNRPRPCR